MPHKKYFLITNSTATVHPYYQILIFSATNADISWVKKKQKLIRLDHDGVKAELNKEMILAIYNYLLTKFTFTNKN